MGLCSNGGKVRLILVFNKVEKKSKREEMFNRMVNRNTKHRKEIDNYYKKTNQMREEEIRQLKVIWRRKLGIK